MHLPLGPLRAPVQSHAQRGKESGVSGCEGEVEESVDKRVIGTFSALVPMIDDRCNVHGADDLSDCLKDVIPVSESVGEDE